MISLFPLGTGHGVGAALNVHEGPHSISFRFGNITPLLTGMIVSNEPGYYEDHHFGIRIEVLYPFFFVYVSTRNENYFLFWFFHEYL